MNVNCSYQKLVPIDQLNAHPSNANKHSQRQIEMLAKIMKYQGWRHPIVVSSLSGFIVAGHGRLAAAKKLGWTECPVDTQDFEDKVQEIAFLYSDNKIAELAEHDDELMKLAVLELQLDTNGFDLDLLGVPDLDLSQPDPDKEAIQDDVPEVTKSISVLGDLYELGSHRLLCGDSTSIDAVEKLMNGEKADMVFTDPPYGMAYKSNGWDSKSAGVRAKRTDHAIKGDESVDVAINAIRLLPTVIKSDVHIFLWCRWDSFEDFRKVAEEFSTVKGNVVWDKGDAPGLGDLECSFGGNEMAVHAIVGRRKLAKRINSVWQVNRPKGLQMVHPTQKPIEIVEPAIENCTSGKDLVLDLFGGSGSTLIACEKTKRKCYMAELDPHYVDTIVTRWCRYTGKTSIKRNGEPMEWTI